MKKNWKLIVAVVMLISGIGNLAAKPFMGIICFAITALLIIWHFSSSNGKKDSLPRSRPNKKTELAHKFLEIKVKGVTFRNEDGTSRQALLRKMKFQDKPFDGDIDMSLREYDYEGNPAVGVYANDQQIGNVPKEDVPYLIANWDNIVGITDVDVYGGGTGYNDEKLSWGASITVKIKNTNAPMKATSTN